MSRFDLFALQQLIIEGQRGPLSMLQVDKSMTVGEQAYDIGAAELEAFFRHQLGRFTVPDLDPLGKRIIDCALSRGTVADYESLNQGEPVVSVHDD